MRIFSDELLRKDANNFTLVRIFLALLVIYSHCYSIFYSNIDMDAFSRYIGAPISNYAVDAFFFLSGFLVYPSIYRLSSGWLFLGARFSRIWPGLAVAVILTVIIGKLFSESGLFAYFTKETIRFLIGNLTLSKGFYTLTGINCFGTACNVNQSLWTITWEARFYVVLAALYVVGLSRPGRILWVILPLTVAFCVALDFATVREVLSGSLGTGALYNAVVIQRLWLLFLLGTAAYILRHRMILSGVLVAVLLFATLMSQFTVFYMQMRALFVGYAVLYFGFHRGIKKVVSIELPDYSYGIYIYAAPIMVLIHAAVPDLTSIALTLLTVTAVLPVAALSWHFVERPALEFYRQRISRPPILVRS